MSGVPIPDRKAALRKGALWLASAFALLHAPLHAENPAPAFRTDGGDDKLPWFQLVPGEFPPEGAAHDSGGELIGLDHVNRTGVLRPDRSDAIRRSHWDEPQAFTLLAYGSLCYHGAPAELRDIPIGTHLHGLFYIDEKPDKEGGGPFNRVIRLEDDFSRMARLKRLWKVNALDLDKGTLTVTGMDMSGEHADAKPTSFQINTATRIWTGHGLGTLKDITAGQSVLVNLTVCTLKGPGRCTDVWLDQVSQALAASQQLEVHRHYMHEHGLAGRIDEVDNEQGIITITLFDGFDPKLLEDFAVNESLSSAVAVESLRTYDQINDRMSGTLLEIQHGPPGPGNSGIRLKFKTSTLLEGHRPKRILRIFSGKWKVDDLPKEEQFYK